MKHDKRLNAALSLVPEGSVIDIGSDHGYLPVMLLASGKCDTAAASDINEMPLERSRQTARDCGVYDKMTFYLSDGFDNVEGSYNTACVCGMGGIMISDIISRAKDRCVYWVLQPMTNTETLRKYLWENSFEIITEAYAVQSGKPYAVILAAKSEVKTEFDYIDAYLGKTRPDTSEFLRYTEKILSSAEKRLNGKIHAKQDPANEEKLVAECKKILTRQYKA